jgi:hypothetical protein
MTGKCWCEDFHFSVVTQLGTFQECHHSCHGLGNPVTREEIEAERAHERAREDTGIPDIDSSYNDSMQSGGEIRREFVVPYPPLRPPPPHRTPNWVRVHFRPPIIYRRPTNSDESSIQDERDWNSPETWSE